MITNHHNESPTKKCQDIDKRTVLRWEVRTGTALLASFKSWICTFLSKSSATQATRRHVMVVGHRGDATNATVLHGSNVTSLEIQVFNQQYTN